jgi:hypothetical protein
MNKRVLAAVFRPLADPASRRRGEDQSLCFANAGRGGLSPGSARCLNPLPRVAIVPMVTGRKQWN